MIYIIMYLTAIVLANLSVAYFGVGATIINAFLFIGLDLTSRDKLHDAWKGNNLLIKMGLLIASGSLLSWVMNKNAGMIAIASFVSFVIAGVIDTIVYHFLFNKSKMIKINGSNIFSALADSIVFPTIAFGVFMPIVILGQFIAKLTGGFVWSLLLTKKPNDQ